MKPKPTPNDRRIGDQIRTRRLQLKWSQTRLAETAGITFQQIQKYEKGINRVSASRLVQLAEALKVSPLYLIGGIMNGAAKEDINPDRPFRTFMATTDGQALAEAWPGLSKRTRNAIMTLIGEE